MIHRGNWEQKQGQGYKVQQDTNNLRIFSTAFMEREKVRWAIQIIFLNFSRNKEFLHPFFKVQDFPLNASLNKETAFVYFMNDLVCITVVCHMSLLHELVACMPF